MSKWILVLFCLASTAYADSSDSVNLRVDPLQFALGVSNLRLDFKLGDQFALGPEILASALNIGELRERAIGGAINAEFAFDKIFESGWIMDGAVGYAEGSFEKRRDDADDSRKTNVTIWGARVLGGYHWYWGTTFNLALGLGAAVNTLGTVTIKDGNGNVTDRKTIPSVTPAGEANIGWTF